MLQARDSLDTAFALCCAISRLPGPAVLYVYDDDYIAVNDVIGAARIDPSSEPDGVYALPIVGSLRFAGDTSQILVLPEDTSETPPRHLLDTAETCPRLAALRRGALHRMAALTALSSN